MALHLDPPRNGAARHGDARVAFLRSTIPVPRAPVRCPGRLPRFCTPGEHFTARQQCVIVGARGCDLHDVLKAGDLGRFVTGLGYPRFFQACLPFPAFFTVATLAEFGGSPRPDGAVVQQRHGVRVACGDFLDFAEVQDRPRVRLAVRSLAVTELRLGVGAPRLDRAVVQHGQRELEPRLDFTDVRQADHAAGTVLSIVAEAGAELFDAIDAPLDCSVAPGRGWAGAPDGGGLRRRRRRAGEDSEASQCCVDRRAGGEHCLLPRSRAGSSEPPQRLPTGSVTAFTPSGI